MNRLKSNRMRPLLKPQEPPSLGMLCFTCTLAGSALLMLAENLAVYFKFPREYFDPDYALLLMVLIFTCLAFLIPVWLGLITLRGFLRYQFRRGWLTPKIGILSGIVVWGLGAIGFCFLGLVLERLPIDQPLGMLASFTRDDYWTMILRPLTDLYLLLGVAVACLIGSSAGYVLSRQILFDQKSLLAEVGFQG